MALITLGTAATTSLNALVWNRMSPIADIAAIAANIKQPFNPTHPIGPGAFAPSGRLAFPQRRGFINLVPGDYIAYDNYGWPIVIAYESIASGSSWVHS